MSSRASSLPARRLAAGALFGCFAALVAAFPVAAAPAHTHPSLYTPVPAPAELTIENVRVVSEILQGDGRTQITFAADLLNHDSGDYEAGRVYLGALPAAWNVEVTTDRMLFPAIAPAPSAAVAPTQNIVCLAPAASLGDLRSAILAGQYLSDHADEWMIFTGTPALLNDVQPFWLGRTLNLDGSTTLTFTSGAAALLGALTAGDVLVINPNRPLYYESRDPSGNVVTERSALEDYTPFQIASVATVGSNVLVTGRKRALDEVLESATLLADQRTGVPGVADFYDPSLENTSTAAELAANQTTALVLAHTDPTDPRIAQLMGFQAKPIPFAIELANQRIKLSGELFLRALSTQFEVKVRHFVLRRLAVRISNRATVTMAITAAARTDNTGAPLLDKEYVFDPVPLPGVPINLGGVPLKVQPWLTFKIGAEISVPSRITIPLMASYEAGLYMGWDDSRPAGDKYFFEPFQEAEPLQLTDPTLFNSLAAVAEVYAEAGLKVIVSEGSPTFPGLNDSHFFSAGPSVSARLTGSFTIAPLGDPWWALDGEMNFFAGFNWSILGYDIIDGTAPLFAPVPLFHADAGGPLLGARAAEAGAKDSAPATAGRLTPVGGKLARWARAFQVPSWPGGPGANGFGDIRVVPVTGAAEDLYVAGANSSGIGAVLRVNGTGDVVWMKQYPSATGAVPVTIRPTPDGGFVLLGTHGNERFVAKHDAAGVRQWCTPFSGQLGGSLNLYTLTDVAVREPTPGTYEYYVCGSYLQTGHVASSDPVVMKFNAAGAIQWMKIYSLSGDDEVNEIVPTADGNLVLCGRTDADVAPPAGTPVGETVFINITPNALLMKVAPDGALLWAKAHASRHGLTLHSLAEAPDGTLYAAGNVSVTIATGYPAMFVGHFAADGGILDHVTISADPDSPDPLPPSANTSLPGVYYSRAYDSAMRLRWTDAGPVLAGTTRLGDARAAWVGGLTAELGLRWFTVFDGPRSEEMYGLTPTTQGLALAGMSSSFLPFGTGGTWANVLYKLPWEGLLEFHEATNGFTQYIKPRIYHSAGTNDFQTMATSGGLTATNATSPVPFTVSDFVPVAGSAVADLIASATVSWVPLERRDPAQVQSYADWVEFFQIPAATSAPAQNNDGDARTNGQEYFFGGTPYAKDNAPPSLTFGTAGGDFLLTAPRSVYAANVAPVLETSTDLATWSVVPAPVYGSTPLGPFIDLLSFTLAPTAEPRRFWRVSSPALP